MKTGFVNSNLSFLVVHGSQAYATNDDLSDLDVKGFCIVPEKIRNSLFHRFDQSLNNDEIQARDDVRARINPKNPKVESTVYSLAKFFQLAAQVNPNIIEAIWGDEGDIIFQNEIGRKVRQNRELFLSKKAKFTFQGYAFAQAAKIERHRKWLIDPPNKPPERKDFGLADKKTPEYDSIYKVAQKQIEHWNLSHLPIDQDARNEIKEETLDLINFLRIADVDWSNWPEKYTEAAILKFSKDLGFGLNFDDLIRREHLFQVETRRWKNYLNWQKNRNPERAKLEEKHKFDCKHAMHLLRLARMGCEILEGKGVLVKRPDSDELKSVRFGEKSYDWVMTEFEAQNKKMDQLYLSSNLRNLVDFVAIDELYCDLIKS